MRKIWNRPSLPVWSLVTRDVSGQANMNICTYVTAISMEPKLMMIAVYHNTKTLENLEARPTTPILLQLLSATLAPVVRTCGQQSGLKINKMQRLAKRYSLAEDTNLPYFTEGAGYLILQPQRGIAVSGDHVLYTCAVVKQVNLNDVPLLTTEVLRAEKIIR